MIENSPTPPNGLSVEQLAEWWRKMGAGMDRVKTLSDLERECPRCKAVNPCTGNTTCIQCGGSLRFARRLKNSTRHTPENEQDE